MIKELGGNLFAAEAEALVNAVNCTGVMGKGLALQFKQRFPAEYFESYKLACRNGKLTIGKVQVYELKNTPADASISASSTRFIINFPTKDHWRGQSRIEYIESGLRSLVEAVERYRIESIAIPALGCGLGGLDWDEVKPLIKKGFSDLPTVEVLLFPPK